MKKEDTTISGDERKRIEQLRDEIMGFIETPPCSCSYDDDDEEYDDYNTDDPSPVEEEPVYDTCPTTERLYILYRNTILQKMN